MSFFIFIFFLNEMDELGMELETFTPQFTIFFQVLKLLRLASPLMLSINYSMILLLFVGISCAIIVTV